MKSQKAKRKFPEKRSAITKNEMKSINGGQRVVSGNLDAIINTIR